MKNEKFRDELDLPKYKGAILTAEDRILYTLYKEKGSTKGELSKITGMQYPIVKKTIDKMEEKGLVVSRVSEGSLIIFYLTMFGAYESQDRLNNEVFRKYHSFLINMGYPYENVSKFLRKKFYLHYLTGEWNPSILVEQYKKWCDENEINYTETLSKKLVLK